MPLHPHVAHQLLVQGLLQEHLTHVLHVADQLGSQDPHHLPHIIDSLTRPGEHIIHQSDGLS